MVSGYTAVHWIHNAFLLVYPYLRHMSKKADFLFIAWCLAVVFHWRVLQGECILSLKEKQYYLPDYQKGSAIFLHPWNLALPVGSIETRERIKYIVNVASVIGVALVIARQDWKPSVKLTIALTFILVWTSMPKQSKDLHEEIRRRLIEAITQSQRAGCSP